LFTFLPCAFAQSFQFPLSFFEFFFFAVQDLVADATQNFDCCKSDQAGDAGAAEYRASDCNAGSAGNTWCFENGIRNCRRQHRRQKSAARLSLRRRFWFRRKRWFGPKTGSARYGWRRTQRRQLLKEDVVGH
jgi:hypothetical protein